MDTRRTLLNCLHGLLWVLPLVAVFSGKLTLPVLIIFFLWLAVTQRHLLRERALWRELLTGRHGQIILLLLGWPLLMAWHSLTPGRSFTSALSVAGLMLLGALTVTLARRGALALPMTPVVGSLLIAILAPLLLILQEQALDWHGLIRHFYQWKYDGLAYLEPYNEFMEKSMNRSLCVMALALWPAVHGLWRMGRPVLACALPLLMIFGVFSMQSTSALLAAGVGTIIFHLVRFLPRLMPRLLAGALLLFLLAWPLVYPSLYAAAGPGTELFDTLPRSAQHRLMIWDFTLDHIHQKPWLGWGMDTARSLPGGTEEFAPGLQKLPLHPHNSVLQLLLEQGIPGLLLSLAALMLVLRDWLRLCATDPTLGAATGAALFSFLLIGFTAFGLWQSWWIAAGWLVWVFFRLALGYKINKKDFMIKREGLSKLIMNLI